MNKIIAKVKQVGLTGSTNMPSSSSKSKKKALNEFEGYDRVEYATRLLKAIVKREPEVGPQNYFYFSGYLSGILLNSKPLQSWPFIKVSEKFLVL